MNPVQTQGGLEVRDLRKDFRQGGLFGRARRVVRAVDGVDLAVAPGGSLGLVGESGCGKSTAARCILRLVEADGGTIRYEGTDVRAARGPELRRLRRRVQMVFQDPYSTLNPKRTVGQTLEEPLRVHGLAGGRAAREAARALLAEVGLGADALERYPHEFSGGQRQRVGIARALILGPSLLVADEPVSALDVSVQAQILRLLDDLRERRGLSFLFVSHDLGVVRHICESVAVMYLGRVVERGPVRAVFDAPLHPYTRVLRAASPVPDPGARVALARIEGEIPSATAPPPGCGFHPRCPLATARCRQERPALREVAPGRAVACHHSD
ncbi:MAG TPA: oligopeptide/dipeptide ABC transporter ATP-binding protein [Azospirillum sp.]|nr:oligopeptide/dipeptide ABC transporter ATP-binding protein [Azospirillum sp.]